MINPGSLALLPEDDLLRTVGQILSRPGEITERDLQELDAINTELSRREYSGLKMCLLFYVTGTDNA